jgi:hypothetical protein
MLILLPTAFRTVTAQFLPVDAFQVRKTLPELPTGVESMTV